MARPSILRHVRDSALLCVSVAVVLWITLLDHRPVGPERSNVVEIGVDPTSLGNRRVADAVVPPVMP